MAQAVKRLFPETEITIGPVIENGFYYDFKRPGGFAAEDLPRIEEAMRAIVKEDLPVRRDEVPKADAIRRFRAMGEHYKVEIIEGIPGDVVSLYTQGEFVDLCRGPHVPSTGRIAAFRLTSLAGAYWRGDSTKPQLTRIYGTAFYSQDDLDAYLLRLEEARKRDHRRLGAELDLFHFDDVSPGSPFWHPRGMIVWNALEDLRRRENARRGYTEVKTPIIFEKRMWVTSGHWEKFRDNMFFIQQEADDQLFGLKPMNCPGHCLVYGSRGRSYRELPVRLAEAGTLHRNEPSGTLHGLLRVRHVTQDDGHTFCRPDQIEDEVFLCLDHAFYLYDLLGLAMRVELSLRPDDKLGSDEDWDVAEAALRGALQKRGIEFEEMPGEGAFYGPKIDIHMEDSLGRGWQLGTVQLDFQMPQRFGLTYQAADNEQRTPAMIHRALFGSLERFIGILIEHYAGAFPFWLAPVQVRVIPVGEDHREATSALAAKIPYRVEVDDSDETVGKRIRNAEVEKIPYVVVWGDKESDDALAVRKRGGEQSTKSLDEFVADLSDAARV
jgi:threonyl-tRNA synthetase